MLTQETLKSLLHYNQASGVFTWKISTSDRIKVGDIAGCLTKGYVVIRIDKKLYRSHRLAYLYIIGEMPAHEIDHINGIKNDNRWVNLRGVTSQENRRNTPLPKDNASGAMGVYWDASRQKWLAHIGISGKRVYLGRYDKWLHAAVARKKAEIKYGFHPNHGRAAF